MTKKDLDDQIAEFICGREGLTTASSVAEKFKIHRQIVHVRLSRLTDLGMISEHYVSSGKQWGRPGNGVELQKILTQVWATNDD